MSRREVLVRDNSPVTITLFSVPESRSLIRESLGVEDGFNQIGVVGDEVIIPASEISQNKTKVPAKDRTIIVPDGQVAIKLSFYSKENHDNFWRTYIKLEEDSFRERF